jgi:hypothetical protein
MTGLNAAIFLLVDDGNKSTSRPNQANMLSSTFTQMGVGYLKKASQTIYTVNYADARYVPKASVSCVATSTTLLSQSTNSVTAAPAGAHDLLTLGATTLVAVIAAFF